MGLSGVAELPVVVLAGLIAHQLEGVAPLDQGRAFRQQSLQLHRTDFRAVLLALAPLLGLLVVVELADDALGGRVSSEWFSRPDDERYLSLSALHEAVLSRSERATARTVETRALRIEASRDDGESLALSIPGQAYPVAPTHWSFGQLCSLVGAPSTYMRQLPAPLAGINLQHGLLSHRAELVKTLETDDGRVELRAVTGPDYGRIWDHELVAAVMRIAGDGVVDTRWKVPGLLDWSTMTHNPFVEVTKDTTTLYASDRDVFLFLVDDTHPIEAGRLPNGDPDLFFRGFYCWN